MFSSIVEPKVGNNVKLLALSKLASETVHKYFCKLIEDNRIDHVCKASLDNTNFKANSNNLKKT